MLVDAAFGFACSLFLIPWTSVVVYLWKIRRSLPSTGKALPPLTRKELRGWGLRLLPEVIILGLGVTFLVHHQWLVALALAGIAAFSSAIPALRLAIRLRLRRR